ncbi:MAG: putative membrane protein [Halonotius sp. J07HN4]|nr:MAG: putative membrane protein [Halonotius sp. J07HN4]
MSRIERKVRSLVTADAEMKPAIETVLDSATDNEVQWVDVRDEISSGQWGRLIEKGILVDGESGFQIESPDAVREGLTEETDDEEIEGSSWTKWDKGAAALTVGLFAGYAWAPARNVVAGGIDLVLGPLTDVVPFYVVVMIIALATGLYSTLLRVALMDTEKMGKYKAQMDAIKEKREAAKERGDDEALEEIQQEQMEAMGDQLGMFKEQFRPMVWIMFLTIPAFLWMYWALGFRGGIEHYTFQNIVIPFAGEVSWTSGIVGPMQIWIVWYFLCSMAFNQIIQKGLNVSMTPSAE